jgi:ketosteroid isomerase-like protein
MYSWIVHQALRRLEKQLIAGEVDKLMAAFAEDAHLVFPGDNSFAGDHRGKRAIKAWAERFVSLKPSFDIHESAVAGPPWNMRIFFRFSDRIVAPDGFEYRNTGQEFIRMRWGKVVEQRVALDTQRVAELDRHLEAGTPAAA